MAYNKEALHRSGMDPEAELEAGEAAGSRAARTAHQFPTNKVRAPGEARIDADGGAPRDTEGMDEAAIRAEDLAATDRRKVS